MNELKQKQLDAYKNAIKKEQDDLVVAYMPALKAMAFKLKARLPSSIDVSDLISVGAAAMVKLSRTYDKEQNDNFWGYVKQRVYGSMLDYLRSLDFISRGNRKLIKEIDNAIDEYFNKFECEPGDDYLANLLGIEESKIREARNLSDVSAVLPIDEQSQLLSDANVESKIEKDELIEKITEVLEDFDEREQTIIQLYYYEELNLKEMSEILGITESRISQIHKRLITKIRERLGF
ncbi:RNA polymerase sigma factor FliA [Campylobacter hyointestinalis]|uniref:RNA polymerase sigma factor FliA n=2 Tax=Campylobacter hyointestinalis TaxID=198 RepID=A0AAV6ED35_CAMHY|nr:RNA polymerase sigma factor FliA [Campylobacter hyointestinalis]ANE33597.1 RNA polymerase sigma28 factor [Campylobacter hyointestinalis subsp. lawsonii CCUG 27631]KAB0611409.1 RNA polymerase sigma factor FliA [Campylobacter hyointestinalis subsp. lawsonii]QKF68783.1 RNA polymerase sigma28 factor [Campylobacter hyointestinalis subsp. lawsonii]RAZ23158.1 RNA polymerase sigma factor FliA [Campylobacter hyointestinalis subsp. lawsonii]RAZ27983.1 RNA polymerase sigma factor FliA [Campylobacter h